jgi:NDP-sugar pyrophosphorylase family protein
MIDCGFHRFFLAVHYLKEQIMSYLGDGRQRGVKIDYIVEDAPQGTAGSLRRFINQSGLPLVVSNGDVVTNQHFSEILQFHDQQNAQITLVCKQEGVDISYGVVESDEKGTLTSIQEKPRLSYLVNTGIYVIDPAVLHLLPQRSYFMTDLVDAVREHGGRVCVFQTQEYWRDVGTMDCYAQVMQDMKLGKVRSYPPRHG